MSEETLTPQTEAPKPEQDPSEGNPFISSAADRSRRIVADVPTISAEDSHDTPKGGSFNKGLAVGIIATTAVGSLGAAVYTANQPPKFSETTNEYVVQPGDGVYNAAEEIKGIDSIDIREAVQHISVDPANIDVLKDGLQAGEILEIPTNVQK